MKNPAYRELSPSGFPEASWDCVTSQSINHHLGLAQWSNEWLFQFGSHLAVWPKVPLPYKCWPLKLLAYQALGWTHIPCGPRSHRDMACRVEVFLVEAQDHRGSIICRHALLQQGLPDHGMPPTPLNKAQGSQLDHGRPLWAFSTSQDLAAWTPGGQA